MILIKFFQKVTHFQSFFQVIILEVISNKPISTGLTPIVNLFELSHFIIFYLVHVDSLKSFTSSKNDGMVLVFWLSFS